MKPRHLFLSILTLVLLVSRVQAATFNVDHTGDDTAQACDDATPNDCSLRGAILAANGLAEASTINVPAGAENSPVSSIKNRKALQIRIFTSKLQRCGNGLPR
jgi:CSLREA domain-containing protein